MFNNLIQSNELNNKFINLYYNTERGRRRERDSSLY